jgi:hypothetical protein
MKKRKSAHADVKTSCEELREALADFEAARAALAAADVDAALRHAARLISEPAMPPIHSCHGSRFREVGWRQEQFGRHLLAIATALNAARMRAVIALNRALARVTRVQASNDKQRRHAHHLGLRFVEFGDQK